MVGQNFERLRISSLISIDDNERCKDNERTVLTKSFVVTYDFITFASTTKKLLVCQSAKLNPTKNHAPLARLMMMRGAMTLSK